MNPLRRLRARAARILDRRIEQVVHHLDQRQTVYCGDHVVLTRIANGRPIYLDLRDTSVAAHVALGRAWEPTVTATLAALARPADTFLDVGANFGYHTLMLADRLTGPRPFRLFEPNPVVREVLRRSLLVNGLGDRAILEEVACSDRAGTAEMTVWSGVWGGASLRSVAEAAMSPWAEMLDVEASFTVPTVTLDEYADARDLPALDLCKIDVEGHEAAVFAGMTTLLDRSPAARMVMEFTFGAYGDPEGFWTDLSDAFPHRRAITDDGSLRTVRTFGDLRAATAHELVDVVLSRVPIPD